jgi:hypothetical protein
MEESAIYSQIVPKRGYIGSSASLFLAYFV